MEEQSEQLNSREDRVHIDLATCDLGELIDESARKYPNTRDVIVVAKHLCGNATDFAMKSVGDLVAKPPPEGRKWRINGMVIAPCCHPKAKWEHFSGQAWIRQAKLVEQEERIEHDWATVLQVLAISKFGSSLRKELDCRSWRHMTASVAGAHLHLNPKP